MKKIHFDKLQGNIWLITVFSLSLILLISSMFKPFDFISDKIYAYMNVSAFLLQAIGWSRTFWFRYYVSWNKAGAYIRVGSFLGRSFTFSQIKSIDLSESILTIRKLNEKEIMLDLNRFEREDIAKLHGIFSQHVATSTAY